VDIGTLTPGTYFAGQDGATITPGWTQVLDRTSGKLVPCDATTCPNASTASNYAPFASSGGLVRRHQLVRTDKDTSADHLTYLKEAQAASYSSCVHELGPRRPIFDVTLGRTGFNPYRTSQFTKHPAVDRRRPQRGGGEQLPSAPSRTASTAPNMVLDLRIPLTAPSTVSRPGPSRSPTSLAGNQTR